MLEEKQGVTYVEIEEPEDALVCEHVEHVAGVRIDDRKSMHAVLDQQLHRLEQTAVGVDAHQRPRVVLQNVCNNDTSTQCDSPYI